MENPPSIQGAGPRGSNFSHPQYPRQAVQATARLPYFSVGFFCFFVYMLAVCMFYGWPALLTFGFSGNLALYYLC